VGKQRIQLKMTLRIGKGVETRMLSKFSGVDKNIIIFVLLGAFALGGIYFFFTKKQSEEIEAAQTQLTITKNDSEDIIKRLAEIRQSGTSGIDDLISKIRGIENAYPSSADDLALASEISSIAAQNNVTLSEISASDSKQREGLLTYFTYSFSITGSQTDVIEFLSAVQTNSKFAMTLGDLTINIQYATDPETGLISNQVTVSGTIKVWISEIPSILLQEQTSSSQTPSDSTDSLDNISENPESLNDLLEDSSSDIIVETPAESDSNVTIIEGDGDLTTLLN